MESDERPRKIQKLRDGAAGEEAVPALEEPILPHESTRPREEEIQSEGEHKEPDETATPISKNQLKKLRKQKAWEDGRIERRAYKKEKVKLKKQEKRQALLDAAAAAAAQKTTTDPPVVEEDITAASTKTEASPSKRGSQPSPIQLPITLILDCSFDDLMLDKERVSLASQVTRCYSDNKNAPYQTHLVVSSFSGRLKHRFETVLDNNHLKWRGISFTDKDFVQAAAESQASMKASSAGGGLAGALFLRQAQEEKEGKEEEEEEEEEEEGETIYLTSDSPNTLTHLSPRSTYIIGGLVDRNRHKGICYQRACDRGLKTAKLPIGEYLDMSSRFVLATNHVVEIMLRWLECGDWGEAFTRVVPKRKGGVLKTGVGGEFVEAGSSGRSGQQEEHESECSKQQQLPPPDFN
ncbi:MAG: tRNA (guanine(9)-N(1))-methyltransferase [Trizodia sp. TS-e1964]|nr:MAG: tRNA (guanine(9)-N(1))-methyltransferase [Trizodia sp. TS-e1964]